MNIRQYCLGNMPFLEIRDVKLLDVGKTFDCGQCFRFDPVPHSPHDSEYAGVAFGKHVSFATEGDTLYIYNSDMEDFEKIWKRYLCLDIDYAKINEDILSHNSSEVMRMAVEKGAGIRILRQDPYEAVVSFIISQNNNIPRIKKIIESMSQKCGDVISLPKEAKSHMSGTSSLCAFPTHTALANLGEQGLFELKTGFRAKYIYDAVSKISNGELDVLSLSEAEDTEECIAQLCTVKGIGLKVASCASLFGLARYDAFPVDVWMKRVAEKYFPEENDFSGKIFGKYAGIAQQYLFYYERYLQGTANS